VFFANLSLAEFFALLGAASAVTVALYLLTRARRRLTVSTLRFWQTAEQTTHQKRRRRIDQPWSLILQLLGILCLLLAAAQPRLGSPVSSGRDHVLILDTSAWMGAAGTGGVLLDEAKDIALQWLARLPAQDRVMLIRAGPLALPATRFETNRGLLERGIRDSAHGAGILDLDQAFSLALQSQRLQSGRAGEIVLAGQFRGQAPPPPNFRYLPVRSRPANAGFTRVTLRRSESDPAAWQAFLTVRNYSAAPRAVPVGLAFGGAVVGARALPLPANSEASTTFEFKTRAAGWVEARIAWRDALPSDDSVALEVPALKPFRVQVWSAQPDLLRPVLSADPRIEARYAPPRDYTPAPGAELAVIDRFAPPVPPQLPALWIAPPAAASPIPARALNRETTLARWRPVPILGEGLRSLDVRLPASLVLSPGPRDIVVADSTQGPVIAARDAEPRLAVFGFHPLDTSLRGQVAGPLVFANFFSWFAAETFLQREVIAAPAGALTVNLPSGAQPESVRVLTGDGEVLPFTLDGRTLRTFSAGPAIVRVLGSGGEQTYSLSLPSLESAREDPPDSVPRGLPPPARAAALPRELWRWFAVLGCLLLALEWYLFARPRGRPTVSQRVSMAIKAAALVAAAAALLDPRLEVNETEVAAALLLDTSASVSDADLARASALAASFERARGRNQLLVFPFSRALRAFDPAERARGLRLKRTAGEAGRSTNLESAIREAAAALPAGALPRIVLVSDGRENAGSAARAAHLARTIGIPVDTIPLAGRPEPRLRLESVSLPAVAFTGERFPIDIAVVSPEQAPAAIELTAEGKAIGARPVTLERGENRFRVHAAVNTPGAIDIAGLLRSATLGELRFEQAVALRRPRVLWFSSDPPQMNRHLAGVLEASQFEVVSGVDFNSAPFDDYQIVILNNWDLEAIAPSRKAALERFVQHGGGLLVIGGERNLWVEKKRPALDPLARTLPATIAPPRSPEGAVVVLVIDKSSSMEGRKMELARVAAIGVIDNLRPIDMVGVLIFDNSNQWAVPVRRAEDRTLIKRLVAGIMPDGGTQIAPALAEAYRRIQTVSGAYRHIVLLTDGISEEGDSINLAKDAAGRRVTISTVGLGQDVNRPYLERIAQFARGKSYFLTEPSGLEQILIRDVMEHTGSTTVEKTIRVVVKGKAEILEGVDMENAPPLKGFVRFEAKPAADTLLTVDQNDPLLSRWQYGLGRAAVFTSDAKSRWAEQWVSWNGFDRFWANVLRDLLPHAQPGEAVLVHDSANHALIAEYRLSPRLPDPPRPPQLYALGPGDFRKPVELLKIGGRHWRATIPIEGVRGLFRVRPLEESRAFPETGIYLPEPELSAWGNNPGLLRSLSEWTGGLFNPTPAQVFSPGGRALTSLLSLWPGLLALAILLNLAELAWRRLRVAGTAPALPWLRPRAA
jgi:uncharacterized membrane protein/uncharacterized protein YegL